MVVRVTWNLNDEICGIAQTSNLDDAMFKLGLIEDTMGKYKIEQGEWERGGAETYILRFSVYHNDQSSEYIVKACTAFSASQNISEIIADWVDRRNTLKNNGIITPRLVGIGKGVIVEQFIPFTLSQAIQKKDKRDTHLIQLAIFAATIHKLGFLAIEPFSDLRSNGRDVIPVDFGQDLGGYSGKPIYSKDKLFEEMLDKLRGWNVKLNGKDINTMRMTYISIVDEPAHN